MKNTGREKAKMKQLRKVRLINWHRFANETIELADATLLSGENGAGKSTILDAIQLVITASKNNFNKAAHDKGRRTLNTYIRCKTGQEGKPYERSGELSAHVALEFQDEQKKLPFILGCVMDSASEEREPNIVWYLMERSHLSDELFFSGRRIRSISDFRSANQALIRIWATTQKQAQAMILQRFGRLEDKFFTLIPKALAFKPISDIKDFVYSYVLDEKKVNIDALRENVRSYQDLSRTLEDVRRRIRELEEISRKHAQIDNCIRIDQYQEYYLMRCEQDILEETVRLLQEKIRSEEIRQTDLERRKEEVKAAIGEMDELITALSVELGSNTEYQTYLELEKKKKRLEENLEKDGEALGELFKWAAEANERGDKLSQSEPVRESLDESFSAYRKALGKLQSLESLTELRELLEKVIVLKKRLYDETQEKASSLKISLNDRRSKKKELDIQIRELEQRRLIYAPEVIRLKTAIEQKLRESGKKQEVRILCEQLEVTDPSWQNAVEGYLNTQRFYLLVSPESFDISVNVYDRLRKEKKAYGVGLINTSKLEAYDEAPADSLASKVTSGNVYARRYVNMVLGRVHCCRRAEELKNYDIAITQNVMRYQNHVVSAIRRDIYRTPYIGARAYEIQLAAKKEEREALLQEISFQEKAEDELRRAADLLDTGADIEVKYRLTALEDRRSHEAALAQIKKDLEAVGADKTFLEKQIRLQGLRGDKKKADAEKDDLSVKIGGCRQNADSCRIRVRELEDKRESRKQAVTALLEKLGNDGTLEDNYRKEKQKRASLESFRSGFENSRKANATRKEQFTREMEELMHAYKVAHDFGGASSYEGYEEFQKEYLRLRDSRLLDYEEKVQKAREGAEEEFREQFLSKLQENIKQAQSEFRELNRSLAAIHFAHEKYEFLHAPKASEQKYYRMIMDDFNVMQGESIFSGIFNTTHKEVIEELFEKLSLDDENSQETLEQYTDYRFYMDYDIKITDDDGSFIYYSKVAREKSGGETQTPFYITVAASFMQLYRGSIGGDAVGLVMMDEAFNNMDDERIRGVLSFMRSSELQLIISAPPEKIQYISPAMDKTLLVLTDDRQSYVEDFSRIG